MTCIDMHTHAFPDPLCERAMSKLLAETDEVTAVLDGRRLADGIYFCRVAGSESPVAKVVVSH